MAQTLASSARQLTVALAASMVVGTHAGRSVGADSFDAASRSGDVVVAGLADSAANRVASMPTAPMLAPTEAAGWEVVASSCVNGVSPEATTVAAEGGQRSVQVLAPAECEWTAASVSPWLHVWTLAGTGSGEVTYFVDPNDSAFPRSASIVANGVTFEVTQEAGTQHAGPSHCVTDLSAGQWSFTADGGVATVGLTADPNCLWRAVSSSPDWLVPQEGEGVGSASVRYTVLPNSMPWQRSARIGVDGREFQVTQQPGPCSYCAPSNPSAPGSLDVGHARWIALFGGGLFVAPIEAPPALAWQASSDAPWIHVESPSGVGPGSLVYFLDPPVSSPRTGQISLNDIVLTIQQAAGTPSEAQFLGGGIPL